MKRSGRIYIIVGVVLAVVAGGGLFYFLTQVSAPSRQVMTPTPVPDVSIVVLAQDVKPGMVLTGELLKRETRKANEIAPDTVREVSEVIDQMLVIETKAGTPLKRGDVQALPFVLPKGKKAMAFFVDDLSTVAGLVRERDMIDIVISGKIKLASGNANGTPTPTPRRAGEDGAPQAVVNPENEQIVVKTVLQRVPVLKVIPPAPPKEQQANSRPPDQPAPAATGTPAPPQAPQGKITNAQAILVLAVTDQEAELLRYARDAGAFQVLLRGRDDTEQETTKGMTLDILVRDYGLPIPQPVVVRLRTE
jgi:pilus assembly protein CpaB